MAEANRVCAHCGAALGELETDFGYLRPIQYFMVPEAQRATRVRVTDDVCVIDEKIFVIRGVMKIRITDVPGQDFMWGFWASVSARSFARYVELYEIDAPDEPPFPGLLAVSPPNYPNLIDSEVTVHLGLASQRPEFRPTSFAHPLFREWRDGITVHRWHEIADEIAAYQSRSQAPS